MSLCRCFVSLCLVLGGWSPFMFLLGLCTCAWARAMCKGQTLLGFNGYVKFGLHHHRSGFGWRVLKPNYFTGQAHPARCQPLGFVDIGKAVGGAGFVPRLLPSFSWNPQNSLDYILRPEVVF